jgi:hypothetical protein
VATGNEAMRRQIDERARAFHLADRACPIAYEPSGEDFLSPCLAEADLMRRVLPPAELARWLSRFLPGVPRTGGAAWLGPPGRGSPARGADCSCPGARGGGPARRHRRALRGWALAWNVRRLPHERRRAQLGGRRSSLSGRQEPEDPMFDFLLTDEQKALREEVRDLVRWVPRKMILDMDQDKVIVASEWYREYRKAKAEARTRDHEADAISADRLEEKDFG